MGIKELIKERPSLFRTLSYATLPQVMLLFVSSAFFIEKGSFQIPIFWALSLPVGIYLSRLNLNSWYVLPSLLFTIILTVTIWIYPHKDMGHSFREAGVWLKNNQMESHSIIGAWKVGIPLIYHRNGNSLEYFHDYYLDYSNPTGKDLKLTNEDKIIIADYNKTYFRQLLSDIGIPGLQIKKYDPESKINFGEISKIYKNEYVTLYFWEK
jgi:hypothetical protein